MKNFDIEQRVKVYGYSDFKRTGKLSYFPPDHKIIKDLEFADSMSDRSREGESQIALIDGDVEIEGNLDIDEFVDEIKQVFFGQSEKHIQMVWITGTFKISGTLFTEENEDYGFALIVEKSVTAKCIIASGIGLYFLRDLRVFEILYSCADAEGPGCFVKGEKEIKIDTNVDCVWQIDGKYFNFYEGVSREEIDQIFFKTPDFLEYSEDDDFYFLDDEELLINAILSGEEMFNSIEAFRRLGAANADGDPWYSFNIILKEY